MEIQAGLAGKQINLFNVKRIIEAQLPPEQVIDRSHMKLLDIHHDLEILMSLMSRSDEKSRNEAMAIFAPTLYETAQAIERVAQDIARLPRR